MKEFNDLSILEQKKVYNNAFTFLHDNKDLVHSSFHKRDAKIPPSGSDMFHPELWKGIHWNWFLSTNFGNFESKESPIVTVKV